MFLLSSLSVTPLAKSLQFVPKKALEIVKKAEGLMAKNDSALDFPTMVEDEKKFADNWKVPEDFE